MNSSGTIWVWGSTSLCPEAIEEVAVDSSLYKWTGSYWELEQNFFDGCYFCDVASTMSATPPGAGWRFVEGKHVGIHHEPFWGVSGMQFYRP